MPRSGRLPAQSKARLRDARGKGDVCLPACANLGFDSPRCQSPALYDALIVDGTGLPTELSGVRVVNKVFHRPQGLRCIQADFGFW